MNFANYTPSGEPVYESVSPSSPFLPSNPTILAADTPLIVPMQLKISLMCLRAIVVLIVSRTTGVTLSFKTDPLESVLVSSTFDSLPSVRRHLQSEIENRLRDLFQKELPAMIHLLSNEWLKRKGLSRRCDDSRDVFSSPESVSSLFPAPNRTLSPSSIAGKNSAPPPRRTKTPKSQNSSSIAAQSAPAELAKEKEQETNFGGAMIKDKNTVDNLPVGNYTEPCGDVALLPDKTDLSIISKGHEVFDFVIRAPFNHNQSCYSEFGTGMILPVDQFYFRSQRNIIVRAPTDLAFPDPVLIDAGKLFKRKPIHVAKLFKSLFKIPEIDSSHQEHYMKDSGLKLIEEIGLGVQQSGVSSAVISTSKSVIPDNCSIRSRTRSMLVDYQMNRALSTVSTNRYARFNMNVQLHVSSSNSHYRHFNNDRYSEAGPDLVQFEPDEFRSSDFQPRNELVKRSKTSESLDGDSKTLAIKFDIMRKLHSTLAPNTFAESNILYRTMSKSRKCSNK